MQLNWVISKYLDKMNLKISSKKDKIKAKFRKKIMKRKD
jgi:hypothetical protein